MKYNLQCALSAQTGSRQQCFFLLAISGFILIDFQLLKIFYSRIDIPAFCFPKRNMMSSSRERKLVRSRWYQCTLVKGRLYAHDGTRKSLCMITQNIDLRAQMLALKCFCRMAVKQSYLCLIISSFKNSSNRELPYSLYNGLR